jgi:cell division protease FtsH
MDRLVEALITEETLSSSRFYELAGLNQPQQAENQLKNNECNKPALAEKPAAT